MLDKTKGKPPPRGSFDYLLDGIGVKDRAPPREHVPDPPPPERRGGNPRRVTIEIEITQRQPPQARRRRLGVGWTVFWLVVLFAALAHAEGATEQRWQHWPGGGGTIWNEVGGSGMRGQSWETQPGTIHSEWQDRSGHVTRCDERHNGNVITLECH